MTDELGIFISESSVYQILKQRDLISAPNHILISAANEANIIMIFEADMKSKLEINLTSTISTFAENQKMGFLIKKYTKFK